jgi:hypothetical protein
MKKYVLGFIALVFFFGFISMSWAETITADFDDLPYQIQMYATVYNGEHYGLNFSGSGNPYNDGWDVLPYNQDCPTCQTWYNVGSPYQGSPLSSLSDPNLSSNNQQVKITKSTPFKFIGIHLAAYDYWYEGIPNNNHRYFSASSVDIKGYLNGNPIGTYTADLTQVPLDEWGYFTPNWNSNVDRVEFVPAYNSYNGGQNSFLADNLVYDNLAGNTSVTPEPISASLFLLGGGFMTMRRYRRNKK